MAENAQITVGDIGEAIRRGVELLEQQSVPAQVFNLRSMQHSICADNTRRISLSSVQEVGTCECFVISAPAVSSARPTLLAFAACRSDMIPG